MHFNSTLIVSLLAVGAVATPLHVRDDGDQPGMNDDHDNEGGLKKICPHLNTQDSGCIRYTKGFDVTGVLTEVDLTFDSNNGNIKDECDCIQACLDRPDTCANYVWKFTDNSGHRTCTLYSNFNLPPSVTVSVDVADSTGIAKLQGINNPQAGGQVPQAFLDPPTNSKADPRAVSGPIWQLQGGGVQC